MDLKNTNKFRKLKNIYRMYKYMESICEIPYIYNIQTDICESSFYKWISILHLQIYISHQHISITFA